MSVFPQRQFNGVPGEPSVDTGGPDMIERDLDEINKMFNPGTTHTGGEQGGISKGNLNFTITNDYDNTEKAKVTTAYTHAGTTNANPHATKAGQIDNTTIAGVVGTNVQSTMEGLKSVIDTKETIENVALKESIADANLLIKTVTFTSGTGTFTFTTQGGTVYTIDTDIEKVPGSMALVEDPVGSGSYYLVLYDRSTPPVELSRCPVSTLFNPINVEDTNTIDLTLTTNPNGSKTLKADIKNASITMAMLSYSVTSALEALAVRAENAATNAEASETNASTYATNAGNSATSASGYATNASNSATASANSALVSEGHAKGQQNGVDVQSGSPYYQNNSKYFKTLSESYAKGGTGARTGEATDNAKYYKEQAEAILSDVMKTSDYDSTEAVKTAGGIVPYVEANGGKIDEIQVNGITQPIVNKVVNLPAGVQIDPQTTQEGDVWIDTDGEGSTGTVVTKVNNLYGDVTVTPALIGAASNTEVVKVVSQNLTDAQKLQARVNISAVGDYGGYSHNGIYRGKDITYLGVTEICNRIANGSFEDLYLGDYITLTTSYGTHDYILGGFDTKWRVYGLTQHHAIVFPRTNLTSAQMNTTNTTEGGYVGSAMLNTTLPSVASVIQSAFNNRVISHQELLSTAINSSATNKNMMTGASSSWGWLSGRIVDLMSEIEVFGSQIFGNGYDNGTAKQRIPVFSFNPQLVITGQDYWLKDAASSTHFALCHNVGYAYFTGASNSLGVRPCFLIG